MRQPNALDFDAAQEIEYEYFIDHFDFDTRREILGRASGFGPAAEKYIFMLRKPVGRNHNNSRQRTTKGD